MPSDKPQSASGGLTEHRIVPPARPWYGLMRGRYPAREVSLERS